MFKWCIMNFIFIIVYMYFFRSCWIYGMGREMGYGILLRNCNGRLMMYVFDNLL